MSAWAPGRFGRWFARQQRRIAFGSALVFAAGVVSAGGIAQAHGPVKGQLWSPFALPSATTVSGSNYAPAAAGKSTNTPTEKTKTPVWPGAARSTVALGLASLAPKPSLKGHTLVGTSAYEATAVPNQPVTLAPSSKHPGQTPGNFAVSTASHALAVAAGVDGTVVSVARADGQSGSAPVSVKLSYAPFAEAYGGGYTSRLRVVELPACALTTPNVAACRIQTPITATLDPASQTLDADVTLPARTTPAATADSVSSGAAVSGQTGAMVLAATSSSSPAGPDGNYAVASSTNPAGQWSAGSGTGSFDYNVPISVPPALGGTAPSLSIDYDSQSVDGKTSMQNAQASWIGDGWNLDVGSIAWSYKPCSKDGVPALSSSGDECWGGNIASISLGSHSGQLVDDAGTWHLSGDDGTQVEYLTGASNGAYNGAYWRVTTPDGTAYYFGANHLPGGDGTDAATQSALTVPVYCPISTDPCYSSSTGSASWKQMVYQWNLDYVVDPNGNLTDYQYLPENNYYSRGAGQNSGSGTLTEYQRGAQLSAINYGFRLADMIAAKGATSPAAKVLFTTSERCIPTSTFTDCSYGNLSTSTASNWPDVPYDQNCPSTDTGTSCTNNGPTFWTTKRLTQIQTQVLDGTTYYNVDQWNLTQSLPATGDENGMSTAVLEFDSITRTGQDTLGGGAAVTLPPVSFTYTEMDNRVDGLVPAAVPLYRPRLSSILTETGGSIAVTYEPVACSRVNGTMPASPDSNTMPCFPVTWTPPGQSSSIQDWFQKILVKQVSETDRVTGDPAKVTNYIYPANGAAWHRDDSPLTDSSTRTWDQWRGYGQVTTETGAAPDPITETVTTYLRGMNGDYKSDGTQRSVSVSTWAGTVTDANQLQGQALETQTFDTAGGKIVGDSVSIPWMPSGPTATESFPGTTNIPPAEAWESGVAKSMARSLLTNGTWRTTETDNTYDPANGGRLVSSDNLGDTSLVGTGSSQEVCTLTSYAASTGYPTLLIYSDEQKTIDGPCSATPSAANTVSDSKSYYDQLANGSNLGTSGTVTHGNVTGIANLDHYDASGNALYTPASATTFDAYGRPVTQTNLITGAVTTTTPTPATGAEPTSVTATGPISGWTTTTTLDPARNVPLSKTDVNGNLTTMTYDGLGRITQQWNPGWSKSVNPSYPSQKFTYYLAGSGTYPNATGTFVLREDTTYSADYKILDGFGNERQEQTTPADGSAGRTISDVWYDSHGWVVKSDSPYDNTQSIPSGTLLATADANIPNETVTTYDGLGRATVSEFVSNGVNQWATTTAYPGADETDTTAPSGGTGYSTFIDARGNTVKRIDYTGNAPTGTGLTTGYTFTADGRPLTITDAGSANAPSGAQWTYSYDAYGSDGGHSSTATDPDTGTTTTVTDNNGDTVKTTDGRGQVLTYTYDLLGRPTAEYNGTTQTSATKLASWTYDSASGGKDQPASSTSYQTVGSTVYGYTESVDGYTASGSPTGETVSIPTTGNANQDKLAGTYDTTYGYTSVTGMLDHANYPAAGGLPAQTMYNAYNENGLLQATGTATVDYLTNVAYTTTGQVQRVTLGDMPDQAVQTYTYDTSTGRIIGINDDVENLTSSADAITYTYNDAGDLTSAKDVQNGAATDLQCYGYDGYQRLAQVWTDPGAQNSTQGANVVDGIGGCAAANPTEGSQGTGPAPYWQSYTYDNTGNRLTEVDHATNGTIADDVTRTSSYANPGQSTWPTHGLGSVTSVGPTGTGKNTYSYDAAGNMTGRVLSTGDTETLTWNPQGALATDTTTNGAVSYLYDASGNALIRSDTGANSKQGQTTLYLPGQEVYLNQTSKAVTADRFISAPGGASIVEQTGGAVWYEFTDPQGTATLDVNGSTLATQRREFTPWGAPRGTGPTAWPDDHTFLGAATDPTTSLVDLGARQYDPTTGRFISVDPVLESSDPRQMGGYTYAGDNPSTHSDPSGLMPGPPPSAGTDDTAAQLAGTTIEKSCDGGIRCMASRWAEYGSNPVYQATLATASVNQAYAMGIARQKQLDAQKTQQHRHWWQAAVTFVYHASGLSDIVDCATDPSVGSCVSAAITIVTLVGTGGESAVADIAEHAVEDIGEDAVEQTVKDGTEDVVSSAAGEGATDAGAQTATDASASAAEDAGPASTEAASSGGHPDSDPSGGAAKDDGSGGSSSGPNCANSFVAATGVLTPAGIVPIAQITVGQQVDNAQPGSSKTEVHTVTAIHVTYTDHDFTKLTLTPATAPSASTAKSDANPNAKTDAPGTGSVTVNGPTITSTSGHLYWDATTKNWTEAGALKTGDKLQEPDGSYATITATTSWTTGDTTPVTYNLTIANLHTYYVDTSSTAVLVHNCAAKSPGGRAEGSILTKDQSDQIADRLGYTALKVKSAGRGAAKIWMNKKAPAALRYITQDTTGHGGGLFKAGSTIESLQTTSSALRSGSYDIVWSQATDVALNWIRA